MKLRLTGGRTVSGDVQVDESSFIVLCGGHQPHVAFEDSHSWSTYP